MPYGIRVCTGLEEGEVYPLFENREITIGRSPTNCQIVVTEDAPVLTDLQSTNGTYVNGERATEQPLHVGDEVRVGTTLLRVEEMTEEGGGITDTALMR